MDLAFPLVVLTAAFALTYAFCVRPMRRGEGHCLLPARTSDRQTSDRQTSDRQASGRPASDRRSHDRAAEVALLRQEVETLRAQLGLGVPAGQAKDSQVSGQ